MKLGAKTILTLILSAGITGCGVADLSRTSQFDISKTSDDGSNDKKDIVDNPQPELPVDPRDDSDDLNPCVPGVSNAFDCLVMKDSFERNSVTGAGVFGWGHLIDDQGGLSGASVETEIYNDTQFGPTPDAIIGDDQKRSVLFTGRPGGSVHSMFLVSKPLNLTGYNSLLVSFDYLAINLGEWNWNSRQGFEHIRFEVCNAAVAQCGAGDDLNLNGLNSSNWSTKFQSADNAGAGLNGHNHSLADWNTPRVNIDLRGMDANVLANFVFRIVVTIDQGFLDPVLKIQGNLEDGIGLDNVLVAASKREVEDNSNVDDDDKDPIPNEFEGEF